MSALLALALLAVSPTPAPLQSIAVQERLGAPIPRELAFRDTVGREVRLGDLFDHGRPVILYLGYSRCTTLCDVMQSQLVAALRKTGFALGRDYDAVTVSIDPHDEPQVVAERRRGYLQALGVPDSNPQWPFLLGGEHEIRALAEAVGLVYRYDFESDQFAHPAVIFVLAPDGRIARYLYGLPDSARDLRLALVEAAGGRVGTSQDKLLLACFRYDPSTRRYGWAMSAILQGGALLVMFTLGGMLGVLWWRDYRRGGLG